MFIKRPGPGRRKTYSLIGDNGKALYDERIDAVNYDLRKGVAVDILEARMAAIRDSFKRVIALDDDNLKYANARHDDKLREKELRAPAEAKRRLIRAVEILGKTSVAVASKEELMACVRVVDRKSRYHVIGAVNELLKQAGRQIRLHNPAPSKKAEAVHITLETFLERLPMVKVDYQPYLVGLMGTGCRLGELPVATWEPSKGSVFVERQVKRGGTVGPTKNSKHRRAPVLPPLLSAVREFYEAPRPLRLRLRLEHEDDIREECIKHLGVHPHALRASYAIEWAKQGVDPHQLAKYIGDTLQVCIDHYARYLPSDAEINRTIAMWK